MSLICSDFINVVLIHHIFINKKEFLTITHQRKVVQRQRPCSELSWTYRITVKLAQRQRLCSELSWTYRITVNVA